MSHVSELDHCKLDATVYPDCVVEVHRVSDISRGLRKVPVTKIWLTERVLGRGTYGEVHLQFQDRDPGTKRAVKVISTQNRMSDVECKRELTALLEFTKPKYKDEEVFVHFLGWFQNDNAMYIAMEYIPLGDLENNLQELEKSKHTGCVLSAQEIKDIVIHILEGLKIMHAEGFAHRDLKPQNVLVVQRKPKWWVKLGDFGLSKRRTEASVLQSQAGTQSYMAPEIFHYVPGLNREYTSAVDIWALGCIMYRIFTGKPPFLDLWSLQRHCSSPELLTSPITPPMTETMGRADSFVRLLLMPHPDARPSASLALKHAWFTASEQPYAPSMTVVDHQSIYAGTAVGGPQHAPTNVGTLPAEISSNGTQFGYNTASHAGLHSNYRQEMNQNMTAKPFEWPVADLQRMREPMPGAFEVEKFDSFGSSEDAKPKIKTQPPPELKRYPPVDDWTPVEPATKVDNKGNYSGHQRRLRRSESGERDFGNYPSSVVPKLSKKPAGTGFFSKILKFVVFPSGNEFTPRLRSQPSVDTDKTSPRKRESFSTPDLRFKIRFSTFSGNNFTMMVISNEKIKSIKSRLSRTVGFPTYGLSTDGLRLNFEGELLKDNFTIEDYGIEEWSKIDLRWINVERRQ